MNRSVQRLLFIAQICVVATFLCSCLINTPPFSRDVAVEYLKNRNIQPEIIKKIAQKCELDRIQYEKFSKSPNEDVRFMIASNPHLPYDIMHSLARDPSCYVRKGVASNKRIDLTSIEMLINDKSSVVGVLVSNSSIPSGIILKIYKNNKNVPLYYFAENPKCPESIRKDIEASSDRTAKELLENWEKRY